MVDSVLSELRLVETRAGDGQRVHFATDSSSPPPPFSTSATAALEVSVFARPKVEVYPRALTVERGDPVRDLNFPLFLHARSVHAPTAKERRKTKQKNKN